MSLTSAKITFVILSRLCIEFGEDSALIGNNCMQKLNRNSLTSLSVSLSLWFLLLPLRSKYWRDRFSNKRKGLFFALSFQGIMCLLPLCQGLSQQARTQSGSVLAKPLAMVNNVLT